MNLLDGRQFAMSQEEVAARLGTTRSNVDQIERKALTRMLVVLLCDRFDRGELEEPAELAMLLAQIKNLRRKAPLHPASVRVKLPRGHRGRRKGRRVPLLCWD